MSGHFANVPTLANKLHEVHVENMRHSQYVTAIENLKHIFTVPDSVQKTKQWINEGKLLHAHQVCLSLATRNSVLIYIYIIIVFERLRKCQR